MYARNLDFLHGGGEAGGRMRSVDWSATPLGSANAWPQSLKTIVRVMLDSRYAMWMLWGPDLTFFCNDAYLPTVGIKRDWVIGARSDRVWQEIWSDIGPRIAHVLETGEATWDEALLLYLERSGFSEETYHTFSYSPVYDDESRVAGMLCVVTEVTERIVGERRLRTLRDLAARSTGATSVDEACAALCAVLAENAFDVPFLGIYRLDAAERRATRVSAHGELPPMLSSPGLLGGGPTPPAIADALRSTGAQIIDLGVGSDAVRAVAIAVRNPGTREPVALLVGGVSSRRPFDDAYCSFYELLAAQFASAMSNAEAHESERARTRALAEIDRAKTLFFSNVSHEFRTPLTLLLSPLEDALEDPMLPAHVSEALLLAHRNARRLQKLVNSLLDFARLEAGRVQATYEPVPLGSYTQDLAGNFRSAVERAGLSFDVDCRLDDTVFVDRSMWDQIVLNLLSNALKFTFAGGIRVRLDADGGNAILEVRDTGVGIASEEVPRLFERFHRIEGSAGRTHEGSGIGLALVEELAKLHGGSVRVESRVGFGSTFTVSLPLGSAHLPAERIVTHGAQVPSATLRQGFVEEALDWLGEDGVTTGGRNPGVAGSDGGHGGGRRSGKRRRVLLADDNADMRRYLTHLLESDYDVLAVGDGAAALRAARESRPDLVLSDVMMPNLDGFGLLKELRSDPATAALPIILLSARAGQEAIVEGLGAGADDYLLKPFSAREVLARVSGALALAGLRAEVAERLRISDERFRSIQDTSPDGFVLLDAVRGSCGEIIDFVWTYANQAALDLVGLRGGVLLGKRLLSVYPGNKVLGLFDRYVQVVDTGEPSVDEVLYTHDGLHAFVRLAVARVGDGVAISAVDLSARWRAEEALKEADRQKDEFLAMLAHELRNPLAPIANAVEFLSRALPAESRPIAALTMAKRQVLQLKRLVDDLLDVSRITQGRIELKREPLNLSQIVAQAVEAAEPFARDKRQRVLVTHGSGDLRVAADPARLMQCIVNVLSNATKYTDADGEIRIDTRLEDATAVIAIADTGVGMAPELVPRVFDLFVQGDRTLDRSQGGLGVGLAVVRRLMEMHEGTVSARSAGPGQGSTIELRLPANDAVLDREQAHAPSPVISRRVLVVDDNRDSADSLAMLLEMEGHDASTAYSAREALERAETLKPQIILLDIGLPEIDGYEVARRLRKLEALERTYLIALTGYGQAEDRRRARSAGFDEHMIKPADLERLRTALAATAGNA
jgi:signal transduction histidine kinase